MVLDPHTVEVRSADGSVRQLRSRHILVATGGHAVKIPVPGAEHAITSDEALVLDDLHAGPVVVVSRAFLYMLCGLRVSPHFFIFWWVGGGGGEATLMPATGCCGVSLGCLFAECGARCWASAASPRCTSRGSGVSRFYV